MALGCLSLESVSTWQQQLRASLAKECSAALAMREKHWVRRYGSLASYDGSPTDTIVATKSTE